MIPNEMWHQLRNFIDQSRKVVVASHRNTDGDAVGSLMAFHEYLASLGKEHLVVNPDPVPLPYHFLDPDDVIEVYDAVQHREAVLASDTWLCLDLNGPKRMAALGELVSEFQGTIVCIDHHLAPDSFADLYITDDKASSTGFLIAQYLEWAKVDWTESLATAVYAAMASDTGNFRFTNTDPQTLRMAAAMVERGAKPPEIYRELYERWSLHRMQLLIRVLQKLEFHAGGRLVLMTASMEDLADTGCVPVDLEDFVNFGRAIEGVEVSALVCELTDRECKASIRSTGLVDVAEVAQTLGGGGHRNAAGVRFDLSLDEAKERLRQTLEQAIENSSEIPS